MVYLQPLLVHMLLYMPHLANVQCRRVSRILGQLSAASLFLISMFPPSRQGWRGLKETPQAVQRTAAVEEKRALGGFCRTNSACFWLAFMLVATANTTNQYVVGAADVMPMENPTLAAGRPRKSACLIRSKLILVSRHRRGAQFVQLCDREPVPGGSSAQRCVPEVFVSFR